MHKSECNPCIIVNTSISVLFQREILVVRYREWQAFLKAEKEVMDKTMA
ncbi:hypothetical protein ACT691_00810 [Vibrio metschnikovii]